MIASGAGSFGGFSKRKNSRMALVCDARALAPVSGSMRVATTPVGNGGVSFGVPLSACFINSIQIGSAALPPYSERPSVLG